jgi:hypothetical protein
MKTKVKPYQFPVSVRALAQRIDRRLAKDGECLRKLRSRFVGDDGEWVIIESSRNLILHHDIDLETLGRELGALRPYERLAEDEP